MTAAAFPPKSLVPFLEALAPRYRVERELGRGGMATVYLATDTAVNQPVAIKVLLPELAASIGADRFLREIEVGRTLQHPAIVGVLDSGEADGRLFYTMPLIEGKSLRDRLDVERQLGIDESIDIVRQIGEGLDYAHSQGIIHRDIKPENILLRGDRAMLADFGIARAVTIAGGEKLTQTGVAVGTPTYMSPEQALGSKDVTAESDIYSLACVLYEMLAGQPPFTGPTAMAIMARHSLDNVPSLKIVRSTIPDAVEDAIGKAMAKVPADRFHTARAFVEALGDHARAAARRTGAVDVQASRNGSASGAHQALGAGPSRAVVIAGTAAVLLLAGLAAWKFTSGTRGGSATKGPPLSEIAVLYLEDRSPDKSLGYLADGLTESLIQEMGRVSGLHVISRNGVAPFKGRTVSTDSVRDALHVGSVVSGTVQGDADSLRVNVALVDARSGHEVGSTTITRPRSQSFALQDDISRGVTDFLRKGIGKQIEIAGQAGTSNAEAYEAYQRARQRVGDAERLVSLGKPALAATELSAADTAFEKVSSLDRDWVTPIVQRGWLSYRQSRLIGVYDRTTYSKWLRAGLVYADTALQLDPKNIDALELRGTLRYWQWLLNIPPDSITTDQLLSAAQGDLDAVVASNPKQASAWNSLSHLLMAKSQTSLGKLAALRAYESDPYLTDVNKTLWRLVQAALDLKDEPDAQKYCNIGAQRFPDDFRFTECRLWLYTLQTTTKPLPNDIWHAYDAFVSVTPPQLKEFHKLKGGMIAAIALLRAGLRDSALATAVRSRGNPEIDPPRELSYLEAIVHAQAGDADEAFRLLNTYLAINPQLRATAGQDESWWLKDLQRDPRWEALKRGG